MSNILRASEPITMIKPSVNNTVDNKTKFLLPVKEGRISSKFGMRMHPILKKEMHHNGTDIAAPEGTEVYAAQAGQIVFADMDGAWGNRIIIVHADTFRTFYGQLSEILVKIDDIVEAGQLIGKVGSTGISTAPHLHFEIRKNNLPVDPQKLVDFSGMKKTHK